MEYPKKLIEVALPLDDINSEASREKSIRHGHPSTLHLWWSRKPLAAARAILFAQLVNDPGGARGWGAYKGQTKQQVEHERERLFKILRNLAKVENINNENVLKVARDEILKSWMVTCKITGENVEDFPEFVDPFSGGCSISLEAQRLGLKANASDLNPIAVMIGKAMIEIPPKFVGFKPIGPIFSKGKQNEFTDYEKGFKGLAEDVRRYAKWINIEAEKKIGSTYPRIDVPKQYGTGKADVLVWLWAQTVASPNPICNGQHVPLVNSFVISDKKVDSTWIEPVMDIKNMKYHFEIRDGLPKNEYKSGTKLGRTSFKCLLSSSPIELDYIKAEGLKGKIDTKLMAIIAEKEGKRIYLNPNPEHEKIAKSIKPMWKPSEKLSTHSQYMGPPRYGYTTVGDLFANRQLNALSTFSELVEEVYKIITRNGHKEYAKAVSTYLAFIVDKCSDYWSTIATWMPRGTVGHVFATHVLPMTWGFPEANPFSSFHCSWEKAANWVVEEIEASFADVKAGTSIQACAKTVNFNNKIVSTDPPYYDNVPYGDISDYFYVWMKHSLKDIYPEAFSLIVTPKQDELIADSKRWGKSADTFFMNGMKDVLTRITQQSHPAFPTTIYYAYKQKDIKNSTAVSKGWETFLSALIKSRLHITGTWPLRTERKARSRAMNSNALASSIVLVVRKRKDDAKVVSRKIFLKDLENILPEALDDMIGGKEGILPIAPVDLAQAAVGPGMSIFSQYEAVLEADGTPMLVYNALILINKAIEEYFTKAESDMDADTRFCADWFQQYGFKDGVFGEADVLARAKGTSVDGVQDAGVIIAKGGKVRLIKVSEYPQDWDPKTDKRTPIWEACHHMCRALQVSESEAGMLLARMPEKTEAIRQLAYRLYTLCERKGWAEDAGIYNGLMTSWHAILEESHKIGPKATQKTLGI